LSKGLIIVESPAKARTIAKFVGSHYDIMASLGHVRDLPKSRLGVDVDQGFTPKYVTIKGKNQIIKELKSAAKTHEPILLAMDPDREGEAIAWHLAGLLKLDSKLNPKKKDKKGTEEGETPAPEPGRAPKLRIYLHEITSAAVKKALKSPVAIDQDKVNAQQARRILDRLVGYRLSPLLWSKVGGGLSAGRVQSVAVRLLVEREKEIQAFVTREYWGINAMLAGDHEAANGRPELKIVYSRPPGADDEEDDSAGRKAKDEPLPRGAFRASLAKVDGAKAEIEDEDKVRRIAAELGQADYRVTDVTRKEQNRQPAPPFTTSTLQQEASRKLGFSVSRTMRVAQQLYEGLDLGRGGRVGLITYMRTDATRVAESARAEALEYIESNFGAAYQGPPRRYKSRPGAQEAHEAIRPTGVSRTPDQVKGHLARDQWMLYRLIWSRFVASQMSDLVLDVVKVEVEAGRFGLRAQGQTVKFPGFTRLYTEGIDDNAEGNGKDGLPPLAAGDRLGLLGMQGLQHFTQPPPRYTEATLVKALEEKGIGRPSTYAPTIETIRKRGYMVAERKRLVPTNLGFVVIELLMEHFPRIVSPDFTAGMEERLDRVEEGKQDWVGLLEEFYGPFQQDLEKAGHLIEKVEMAPEPAGIDCDLCGKPMVIKKGRFGKFIACSGYPECKNTRPIINEIGVPCPEPDCAGQVVERTSRKGKLFFGCSRYPQCSFVSWDRPVDSRCPRCGKIMVWRKGRGRNYQACIDRNCGKPNESTPDESAFAAQPLVDGQTAD